MTERLFFTVKEVAEMLGISRRTLERRIHKKGIQPVNFKRERRGKNGSTFRLMRSHIEMLRVRQIPTFRVRSRANDESDC